MNFPADLRYTQEHEWIAVVGDVATVGVSDFAQSELGDIVYVDIASLGDNLDKDAVFGTVEAVKTVADLFMPVSGQVIEVNKDLDGEPELLNTAPYEKGWLIKIKLSNPAELEDLMDAATYRAKIGK